MSVLVTLSEVIFLSLLALAVLFGAVVLPIVWLHERWALWRQAKRRAAVKR